MDEGLVGAALCATWLTTNRDRPRRGACGTGSRSAGRSDGGGTTEPSWGKRQTWTAGHWGQLAVGEEQLVVMGRASNPDGGQLQTQDVTVTAGQTDWERGLDEREGMVKFSEDSAQRPPESSPQGTLKIT